MMRSLTAMVGISEPVLLVVEVSPRGSSSVSRALTAIYVDSWKVAHPSGRVIFRDLIETRLPFIDLPWIVAANTDPARHTGEQAAAIATSDELIAELKAADRIVVGTPMYNLSIPALLKAYLDQIVRIGLTVTADNKGLLAGRSVDVILASGGDFSPGSRIEQFNLARDYLAAIFRWIGIGDVNFVLAGRASVADTGDRSINRFREGVVAAAVRGA
jgi:FMN-dependent NADH-azoreductase